MTSQSLIPIKGVATWEGVRFAFHLDENLHQWVLSLSDSFHTTHITLSEEIMTEAYRGNRTYRQAAVYALMKAVHKHKEDDGK